MDKFGIFKLLTSFCDFYQKNRDIAPKGMPFDLASNLVNNLGLGRANGDNNKQENCAFSPNKNFAETPQAQNGFSNESSLQGATARAKSTPLQAGMLATLKTHDNFVKRVKEKHGV